MCPLWFSCAGSELFVSFPETATTFPALFIEIRMAASQFIFLVTDIFVKNQSKFRLFCTFVYHTWYEFHSLVCAQMDRTMAVLGTLVVLYGSVFRTLPKRGSHAQPSVQD
jgi:hypothetical protein